MVEFRKDLFDKEKSVADWRQEGKSIVYRNGRIERLNAPGNARATRLSGKIAGAVKNKEESLDCPKTPHPPR